MSGLDLQAPSGTLAINPPRIIITGFEEAAKAAGYFAWNEENEYTLGKYAKKHSAHFVSDISMEIKWKCVKADILTHDNFKYLGEITWKSLKQQFERTKKKILDRCAISQEGANLSGKGKKSEFEEFFISIEKQLQSKKRSRDEKNQKDHEQDVMLNDISGTGLKKQGKINRVASSATKTARSDESDLTNDEDKENSQSSSSAFNPIAFLGGIKESIEKLMDPRPDKDQGVDVEKELRIELLKEQLEQAKIDKAIKKKQYEKLIELD